MRKSSLTKLLTTVFGLEWMIRHRFFSLPAVMLQSRVFSLFFAWRIVFFASPSFFSDPANRAKPKMLLPNWATWKTSCVFDAGTLPESWLPSCGWQIRTSKWKQKPHFFSLVKMQEFWAVRYCSKTFLLVWRDLLFWKILLMKLVDYESISTDWKIPWKCR